MVKPLIPSIQGLAQPLDQGWIWYVDNQYYQTNDLGQGIYQEPLPGRELCQLESTDDFRLAGLSRDQAREKIRAWWNRSPE